MNNSNHKINEDNKFDYKEYLESINDDLEKIKDEYADPLDGILKYNKKGVCITFFGEIETQVSLNDIKNKENQIINIIKQIDGIKEKLNKKDSIPSNLKEIYIKSLESLRKKFLMFQNALWLEGEKSGYKLSNQERKKYSDKILNLQKTIYGEKVSDNPQEVKDIMKKLHDIFEKGKDKLSEEEINTFKIFLKESDAQLGFNYTGEDINQSVIKKSLDIETKNIDKNKLKEISKKTINFYKNHFGENNTDLKNRNIIEQNGINSLNISGMKQEFRIPEAYEDVSSKKINQVVVSHEIEQHILSRDNNNRILGKGFTTGRYDFITEGVAKINEDIALGKVNSIEDLKKLKEGPTIGIIGVFICENYNYDDAVEIIKIYNKLSSKDDDEKCQKKAVDIVKRRKRFVSYNLPGSSIKDTLYQRGKNRVIDYLTEDGSLETAIKRYKNLNTFRFGPEELKYIEDIKKELNVDDSNLIYTLFIGRILQDKLSKGKGSAKEYLGGMNLNRKDIDFKTKRELIDILKQIR